MNKLLVNLQYLLVQKYLYKLVRKLFFKFLNLIQIEIPIKYYGTNYGGWYIAEQYISISLR